MQRRLSKGQDLMPFYTITDCCALKSIATWGAQISCNVTFRLCLAPDLNVPGRVSTGRLRLELDMGLVYWFVTREYDWEVLWTLERRDNTPKKEIRSLQDVPQLLPAKWGDSCSSMADSQCWGLFGLTYSEAVLPAFGWIHWLLRCGARPSLPWLHGIYDAMWRIPLHYGALRDGKCTADSLRY